jgi:hypothetical protein
MDRNIVSNNTMPAPAAPVSSFGGANWYGAIAALSALTEIGECREILLRQLRGGGQDGKAAAASGAVCFPVGFPWNLHVRLRPRRELQVVVGNDAQPRLLPGRIPKSR